MAEVRESGDAALAARLRALRLAADPGLSQTALARRFGWSQAKVAHIERGRTAVSPLDAGRIARAAGADNATVREVIAKAAEHQAEQARLEPVRVAFRRRPGRLQAEWGRIEAASEVVTTFHPSIVPGLLQTEAYMRAIVGIRPRTQEAADEFVRERLKRQEERAERRAVQIVTEGALCWGVAGADVMIDQCRHIADLIRNGSRPRWEIGVIPRVVPPNLPIDYPPNGFDLYDDRLILIGSTAGNASVTAPREIAGHQRRIEVLRGLAAFGDQAIATLDRIADDYRRATR